MTSVSAERGPVEAEVAAPPLRVVTAASLFDGHDAAINVMRRLIQAAGAEVIHLGHNRSVADVVRAAIREDADAIALSSYQGGHLEYFRYAIDLLREAGAGHIRVFGGGGGTITAVVEHVDPEFGEYLGPGIVPKFFETPGQVRWSPTWGEGSHDSAVYGGVLGLTDDELAELRGQGVL